MLKSCTYVATKSPNAMIEKVGKKKKKETALSTSIMKKKQKKKKKEATHGNTNIHIVYMTLFRPQTQKHNSRALV